MKTMKLIRFGLLVMAAVSLAITGCKKDKDEDKYDTLKLQQSSIDRTLINAAVDNVLKDAEKILNGGGGKSQQWVPCNATLDSNYLIGDTITYVITYNGLNCHGNFYREGTAEVRKCINSHWHDVGTVVYLKLINVKFTKVSNGKWAIINGTKRYCNETGGYLAELGSTMTSITHRVTGTITATFPDNTARVWNIARQKTFTGAPGSLICAVTGLGTADGYTQLETWGTTRDGDLFYNEITQAINFREACNWDPCSGSGIIRIPDDNASATLTFGYDNNNQPVTGNDCPTKYRVDWEKNGHTGTLYLPL